MKLATRCEGCGTLFRVVQDQLKVSDGWVRCGRCEAVFDARPVLFDLDLPAGAEASEPMRVRWPVGAADEPRVDSRPGRTAADPVPDETAAGASAVSDPTATTTVAAEADAPGAHAGTALDERLAIDTADAAEPPQPAMPAMPAMPATELAVERSSVGFDAPFDLAFPETPTVEDRRAAPRADPGVDIDIDTIGFEAAEGPDPPLPRVEAASPVPDTHAPVVDDAVAAEPPLFARASWRPARSRTGTWIGTGAVLLLASLLGTQVLMKQRDLAVARWPALQPALATVCGALGCRLGPPRRIDDIAVENTSLALTALPGAYRLSVGLLNRADTRVAVPSVDLALTDTDGKLLARRVLGASDFPQAPVAIEVGGELPLQALLAVPGGRVSGYTVEIFYP